MGLSLPPHLSEPIAYQVMCRAVQLPRANNVPNIIDWLDVAAERDTDVDLYRLADTHELPGIREEVMNTENVWAYELDPSGLEDEADDSDEEIERRQRR